MFHSYFSTIFILRPPQTNLPLTISSSYSAKIGQFYLPRNLLGLHSSAVLACATKIWRENRMSIFLPTESSIHTGSFCAVG